MLPILMAELRYCLTENDESQFENWFANLDFQAAAKVTTSLIRLEQGNVSKVKAVGAGVSEFKIDWGPGYRIYFGRDGEALVILLYGGTKQRQDDDITSAKMFWNDYKKRRKA